MPPIAIAPIIPQTSSPSAPAAPSEVGSFSPHLDQAINKRNSQANPNAPGHSVTSGEARQTAASQGDKSNDAEIADTDRENQAGFLPLELLGENGQGMQQEVLELLAGGVHKEENSLQNLGQTIAALLATPAAAKQASDKTVLLPQSASPVAVEMVGTSPRQQQSSPQSASFAVAPLEVVPSVEPPSNPLLEQLQRIIDSGEQGITVTIHGSGQSSRLSTAGGKISLRMESLPQTAIEVVATEGDSIDQPLTSLYGGVKLEAGAEQPASPATPRHSLQQQYFDSKLTLEAKQESGSGVEDGQQQNPATTGKGAFSGESSLATGVSAESPSTFSQPLAQAQEGLKPLAQDISRPVTLPSGTMVHQEEVIRQIVERFHLSQRDSNTRVNLQLHPAELGKLRIDLSVKNGTVRANVIASTQITQDIIEKNMPRLRSILESQGFTIDELLVSNNSRSIDDFNLFDQHLFGQHDSAPSSQQGERPGAVFSLEGILGSNQEVSANSVNLKA